MNEVYEVLSYSLWGGCRWMNRTHCTHGDLAIKWATIIGALWMAYEYLIVAINSHRLAHGKPPSAFLNHHIAMRNVFLECGAIHILGAVASWWFTPYWIIAVLYFHNAMQTRWFNRNRLDEKQFEEVTAAFVAVEENHYLRDEVNDLRVRAESLLTQRAAQNEYEHRQEALRRLAADDKHFGEDQP